MTDRLDHPDTYLDSAVEPDDRNDKYPRNKQRQFTEMAMSGLIAC